LHGEVFRIDPMMFYVTTLHDDAHCCAPSEHDPLRTLINPIDLFSGKNSKGEGVYALHAYPGSQPNPVAIFILIERFTAQPTHPSSKRFIKKDKQNRSFKVSCCLCFQEFLSSDILSARIDPFLLGISAFVSK
jgi:hypothetical protein